MKLQLWIFFGNECAAASSTGGCAVDLAGKTAVAQFPLQCAHVVVRRNESDDRKPDPDRQNKQPCHINVSNPDPRLLLRWFKPSRLASGALVSTLARRYFL
jgi:hypothetical protein